jgi:hypothetical protein
MKYTGSARIFIPTHPGTVLKGEKLDLKVIILSKETPSSVKLCWKSLGSEKFFSKPVQKINRGVYQVNFLEGDSAPGILEYYFEATTKEGKICWPATAPEMCQTVLIAPSE